MGAREKQRDVEETTALFSKLEEAEREAETRSPIPPAERRGVFQNLIRAAKLRDAIQVSGIEALAPDVEVRIHFDDRLERDIAFDILINAFARIGLVDFKKTTGSLTEKKTVAIELTNGSGIVFLIKARR